MKSQIQLLNSLMINQETIVDIHGFGYGAIKIKYFTEAYLECFDQSLKRLSDNENGFVQVNVLNSDLEYEI